MFACPEIEWPLTMPLTRSDLAPWTCHGEYHVFMVPLYMHRLAYITPLDLVSGAAFSWIDVTPCEVASIDPQVYQSLSGGENALHNLDPRFIPSSCIKAMGTSTLTNGRSDFDHALRLLTP